MDKAELVERIRRMILDAKGEEKVYVEDEQSFLSRGRIEDQNAVYVVVRFGNTTENYGAYALPITLMAMALPNSIKRTQSLLERFVKENHNKNGFVFETPSAIGNFNEIGNAFRSLFTVSGFYLANTSGEDDEVILLYKGERVNFLTFNDSLDVMLEPQIYADGTDRAKSFSTGVVYTFSIMLNGGESSLLSDIEDIRFGARNSNEPFSFNIKKGEREKVFSMRLKNATYRKGIGEISVHSLAFSE